MRRGSHHHHTHHTRAAATPPPGHAGGLVEAPGTKKERSAQQVSVSPQQVSALSDRLYARAEMKKLHLERLTQQAREQEGTFKPTMFTSSKHRELTTSPKPSVASLGDRLSPSFEHVNQRRIYREQERLREETQNCTFKPRLNKQSSPKNSKTTTSSSSSSSSSSQGAYPSTSPSSSPKNRSSGLLGLSRLSPTPEALAQQQQRRELLKQQEELKHCSFSPTLYTTTSSSSTGSNSSSSSRTQFDNRPSPTPDQLKHLSTRLGLSRLSPTPEALAQQQQRRELLRQQEELKHCSFSPTLYTSSSTSSTSSSTNNEKQFHNRLSPTPDQLKHLSTQRAIEKARKELEHCTFRPAVSDLSPQQHQQCQQQQQPGGEGREGEHHSYKAKQETFDKLYLEAHAKESRLAEKKRQEEEEESRLYFKPTLPAHTYRLRGSKMMNGWSHEEEKEEGGEGEGEDSELRTIAAVAHGSRTDIFERLYSEATTHACMLEEKRREQEERDRRLCTFSPQLPDYPLPPHLAAHEGSKIDIFERLYFEAGSHARMLEEKRRQQEEIDQRACTFSPLLPDYRGPQQQQQLEEEEEGRDGRMGIFARLYDDAVTHQRHAFEARSKQKEEEEMQGCTFSPHLPEYSFPQQVGGGEGGGGEGAGHGGGGGGVFQRLYEEAAVHRLIQAEMERRKGVAEMELCTFLPKIPQYPPVLISKGGKGGLVKNELQKGEEVKEEKGEGGREGAMAERLPCTSLPQISHYRPFSMKAGGSMRRGAAEEEGGKEEEEGRWESAVAEKLPRTSLPQISQYRSPSVPMRGEGGLVRRQITEQEQEQEQEHEAEEEEQEAEEEEQEQEEQEAEEAEEEQQEEQGVQREINPGLSTSVTSLAVYASSLPPSPVTTTMAGTITKEAMEAAPLEGQSEITSSLSSLSSPSPSSSSLQQIYLEASKRLEELHRRKEAIAWVNNGSSSSSTSSCSSHIRHIPVAATEQQHRPLEQQKQQHPSSFQQEGGEGGEGGEKIRESNMNELMQRQGQGEEGREGRREGRRHEGVGDWLYPIEEGDYLDESEQQMYINGSSSSTTSTSSSGINGSIGGPSLLSMEETGGESGRVRKK